MSHANSPLEKESLDLLRTALDRLERGFNSLPAVDEAPPGMGRMDQVLQEVAGRLQDNYPFFHPLYAGQMLKPPHPLARLAYALALWINPNNHALDGGRATSAMEKEAVAELARMFGWRAHLGHLTSGGTMANLEALWVAGQLHPGKKILASQQAHYTHQRISHVLRLQFESVACDRAGRLDLGALQNRLGGGDIGTVVATCGTTATGAVDPLPELLELRSRHGFRLHVDAAYGGYFGLVDNLQATTRQAYDRLGEADSIVIDPHKHGLQPYGCGCVLFADPSVGRFYKHDSPYTYFTSSELHLGEISLECSRPGASAAALWATQRLLPLDPGEEHTNVGPRPGCRARPLRPSQGRRPLSHHLSTGVGHSGLGSARQIGQPGLATERTHLQRSRQAQPAPCAGTTASGVLRPFVRGHGEGCGHDPVPPFRPDETGTRAMARPDLVDSGPGD